MRGLYCLNQEPGKAFLCVLLLVSGPLLCEGEDIPSPVDQHYQRGIQLLTQQKFDEAIAEFQAALGSSANSPEIHNQLGLAWIGKGELRPVAIK